MMFRSNMGFVKSLVWEALRQLAVVWPKLKTATMAFFNRLLDACLVLLFCRPAGASFVILPPVSSLATRQRPI